VWRHDLTAANLASDFNSMREIKHMDHTVGDRLAIRELIELYSDAVTRRDWQTTGAVFVDDAIWTIGPPTNITLNGRAAIVEGLTEMVTPFDLFVQMTHSIVIELNGDRAAARTIVNGFGRARDRSTGVFALGTYTDAVVRDGDRWAFQNRRFDAIYIDTAVPPGTAFGPFATVSQAG
jgi:hypothetical protein